MFPGQHFEVVSENINDLLSLCIIFLFDPLPCASQLVVGYQLLSETVLRMFFILYVKAL